MTTVYRARWVVPIDAPPVEHGLVVTEAGNIRDVGPAADVRARLSPLTGEGSSAWPEVDLGDVALMPGLVNAHGHLELSWLRGRVPPAETMPSWVRQLIAARRDAPPDEQVDAAIEEAIDEAERFGTIAVGDIGNTSRAFGVLKTRRRLRAPSLVFLELLGFGSDMPDQLVDVAVEECRRENAGSDGPRLGLAAHAPYSVSPALFAAVRRGAGRLSPPWASVHLAESAEELRFLENGHGPWRQLLEDLGAWTPDWQPPASGALAYLENVGFAHRRMVVVHGTQLAPAELDRLAAWDATLVTCPRSNGWVGAGVPPVEQFFASGVRVAIGTDSLASNSDLNVFAELAALRRLAPGVSSRRLLAAATVGGAAAIGLEDRLGTVTAGKQAAMIAVDVPSHVADVEDYLVSGIEAGRVSHVDAAGMVV